MYIYVYIYIYVNINVFLITLKKITHYYNNGFEEDIYILRYTYTYTYIYRCN